jgi:site-specific DNA recombinase
VAGATVYELAARFKIHRTTVSEHLHRAGIEMRRRGLIQDQIAVAMQFYGSGWSLARIADRYGVDVHTVWSALLKQGVVMRDTHGRAR